MAMFSPRIFCIAFSGCPTSSWPRYTMLPVICAYFGNSPRIAIDVTLLPEPDSPTMPSVSSGCRSKLMFSTAWTSPSSVAKRTHSERTDRSGASSCTAAGRSASVSSAGMIGLVSVTPASRGVLRLRVECVAEAVAEEVHAQHHDEQHHAGEQEQVHLRRVVDRGFVVGEHQAPRRLRRLDAEAQEREGALGDDR